MIKKITKMTKNPRFLISLWVVFLLSPLFSVFRHIVINSNMMRFHIRGFSTFLLYLPLFISFVAFISLIFWTKKFLDGNLSIAHKKNIVRLTFLSLIFLIIVTALLNLEYINYSNYLYEHYGLIVSQLKSMSFIATLEFLMGSVFFIYKPTQRKFNQFFSKKKSPSQEAYQKDLWGRASLFLSLIGFFSLIILSLQPFINWTILLGKVRGNYEKKVGVNYAYLDLLSKNTPEDSFIIHPPQGDKWPAIGNQPLIRYFLYPRNLVSGFLFKNQDFAENFEIMYFIEIGNETDDTHWPKINDLDETVVFDEENRIKYKSLEVDSEHNQIKIFKIIF